MSVIVYFVATILVAADVACAEASHDWREVDAVLQVAVNRADNRESTLLRELSRRRQFAHNCPQKRTHWKHAWAATRAMFRQLDVPKWLKNKDVLWFCTRTVAWKWHQREWERWSHRIEVAGSLRHLYWRRRS